MNPIEFKEQNKIYAKDQDEYLSLPVYEDEEQGGRAIHCWKLSVRERIHVLLTGKLWINVLNFGKPLQPIMPMVNNPFKEEANEKRREALG